MFPFFSLVFLFSFPALILGMIVPKVYGRLFKNGVTRGKIAKTFGAIILTSFIGLAVTAPPVESKAEAEQPVVVSDSAVEKIADTSRVVKVIDGDTVTVETNGAQETIRIIGINTPETVDPRKPVECFGQEASTRAHELLDNQTVTLEADATQGEHDKYNRLLRYVFLADGSDFGKQMITEGYAYEYTYSTAYNYQKEYKSTQEEAQTAKRGLWADGMCSDAKIESKTTTEATGGSTSPAATTTTSPKTDLAPTTASCSCSANIYNCGDFTTHAAAQSLYNCCMTQVGSDVHKLDGSDKDGLACESLP